MPEIREDDDDEFTHYWMKKMTVGILEKESGVARLWERDQRKVHFPLGVRISSYFVEFLVVFRLSSVA